MKNYSKQREAIKEFLANSKAHPSASTVYNEVRKKIPNISLGTVYRNLADLQDSGEIVHLSVGDGTDRFDGDLSPHIHLVCRDCNGIFDLPLENDYGITLATESGFCPESSAYYVYGVCENCSRK